MWSTNKLQAKNVTLFAISKACALNLRISNTGNGTNFFFA